MSGLDDIDRAKPPCTACGADMMGLERLASLTAGPWCHMCKGRVEWRFEELNAIQSICDWYAISATLRRLRAVVNAAEELLWGPTESCIYRRCTQIFSRESWCDWCTTRYEHDALQPGDLGE